MTYRRRIIGRVGRKAQSLCRRSLSRSLEDLRKFVPGSAVDHLLKMGTLSLVVVAIVLLVGTSVRTEANSGEDDYFGLQINWNVCTSILNNENFEAEARESYRRMSIDEALIFPYELELLYADAAKYFGFVDFLEKYVDYGEAVAVEMKEGELYIGGQQTIHSNEFLRYLKQLCEGVLKQR